MVSAKETMPLTIQTTEKYLMKYKKEGEKCKSQQKKFLQTFVISAREMPSK